MVNNIKCCLNNIKHAHYIYIKCYFLCHTDEIPLHKKVVTIAVTFPLRGEVYTLLEAAPSYKVMINSVKDENDKLLFSKGMYVLTNTVKFILLVSVRIVRLFTNISACLQALRQVFYSFTDICFKYAVVYRYLPSILS